MRRPPRTDEGTEVFSAATVDLALQAARAAHGPHVQVVRALRVVSGVRGLLGQARYDVVVRPASRTSVTVLPHLPAEPADPVASALDELLDAAEERERQARAGVSPAGVSPAGGSPAGRSPAETAPGGDEPDGPGWSWSSRPELDRLLAELTERVGAGAAAHPAPELAGHDTTGWAPLADPSVHEADPVDASVVEATVEATVEPPPVRAAAPETGAPETGATGTGATETGATGTGATETGATETGEPVPRQPAGTGWDRAELRRLGVPGPVLSRLPVEDPSDDAGWRRALRSAIAAAVPAPARPDEQHPVVVSGYGLLGVVAILRAGVEDGLTPGVVCYQGRFRPATPAALVDVLAACART